MDLLPTWSAYALPAVLLLLWLTHRRRARAARVARAGEARDSVDTVAGWPPEAACVLTADELKALDLVGQALPGLLVLAQVPLSRFIRVPLRRSYAEWLQRVGTLSADLLLCDPHSRVLAVIDIRAGSESARSRRRHERMERVLRQAGIPVCTWREGALPEIQQVRNALGPLLAKAGYTLQGTASRPLPLIPVADVEEILADGDRAAAAGASWQEPVPSGYFDDLDAVPSPAAARR